MSIRLSNGKVIPMEMHKIKIVQKTTLSPAAGVTPSVEK